VVKRFFALVFHFRPPLPRPLPPPAAAPLSPDAAPDAAAIFGVIGIGANLPRF
jgi:hypothetical protein